MPRDRTKTVARSAPRTQIPGDGARKSNIAPPATSPAPRLAAAPNGTQLDQSPSPFNARQIVFRCARLTLAGALVSCAAIYARTALLTARSEQAFINAEITALRAPIPGEVRLETLGSGRTIRAGMRLFSIENARFGNEQAVSQLNFVTELAQRLQAESEEAAVTLRHEEEVTQLNERMFAEKIIPRMELIDERAKRDLAATILTNKLVLAKKAAERVAELTHQAELQHNAIVRMPFDGVAWSIPARNGSQVSLNESVVEVINPNRMWVDARFNERHAARLAVGREVTVQTSRGELIGRGRIESVRAGIGRIPLDGLSAVSAWDDAARTITVRVRLDSNMPYQPSEFFGVGRNVVVTLNDRE